MEYVNYWTLPTSRGHHPGRSYCLEKSKKNDPKIFRKKPENPTHEHRRDGVRQLLNITHQLQPLPRQKWVSPSKKKKSTLKKTHYPPASSKFPKIALFFVTHQLGQAHPEIANIEHYPPAGVTTPAEVGVSVEITKSHFFKFFWRGQKCFMIGVIKWFFNFLHSWPF